MKIMEKMIKNKQNKNIIDFSKFRGKNLAMVNGKIVAQGSSSKEVFEKAKKLFPQKSAKDILLLFVPKEEVFIYFL